MADVVSNNQFPKIILQEVASDGSDTSNPPADFRALILGEDGALHLRDSGGTVTDVGGDISAHTGDTTDAHDASAISIVDSGTYFTGTDVEAALQELGAATASPDLAGKELDFVERTSNLSITGTNEGTANTAVTGASVAYDGSTVVEITWYCQAAELSGSANNSIIILLYDGATVLGRLATISNPSASALRQAVCVHRRLTPTNASHQYIIKAYATAGTANLLCGSGGTGASLPGYMSIKRVTS